MLEGQVAQEESVTSPDPNPTVSDTDGTGAEETEAQLEAEQEVQCPIDATSSTWAQRDDEVESKSDCFR